MSGWEGRWLIPGWAAVAASYDGMHLSVAGHLQASYRALPVAGGACTCIAGWDPDETIWLTDVLASAKLAARWEGGSGSTCSPGDLTPRSPGGPEPAAWRERSV